MAEKGEIVGHQVKQTGMIAIATVIVAMSALLAFITVPPQPIVLLLGILIAVVIYWVSRTTEGTTFQRSGPHEERVAVCATCGFEYCPGCEERCPECGSVHIRPSS